MLDERPHLSTKLTNFLSFLYPDENTEALTERVVNAFWPDPSKARPSPRVPDLMGGWSEKDTIMITYGDSIVDGDHKPVDLLFDFVSTELSTAISGVHILPFFPYSSDGGFAVTDYDEVNPKLGTWVDIKRIASKFSLMSDLVLNHVSAQGKWFEAYKKGEAPFDRFFFEADPKDDLSEVVRPRTNPLLQRVETDHGEKHIWCTFSFDQVDLDFSNPDVLIECLRVMRLHIDNGVRIIRLDAVAFIWKEVGTSCIHLPQTHAIVQLMRLVVDYNEAPVILLTETNVPNAENLSYFGNRNEAHAIYNFPLPPLILHALLTGTSDPLNRWQMGMPPAQMGCAYLNFTASHDGIGVRPAEGLLDDDDLALMIEATTRFGGKVSMRAMPSGEERPYELNITYFEALKGTSRGEDGLQFERFMCSQSIIMALEGIPAFYIHALLATPNDHEGAERTGVYRDINRHRWDYPTLKSLLSDETSINARVLAELRRRLEIRRVQGAFHPNATQFTLQLGSEIFGFWRQSLERDQSIFALHNVSDREISIPTTRLNLIAGEKWTDLLSGEAVPPIMGEVTFQPYQCRWISNIAK